MDRKLVAILIADVVGYSRLSHVDEEGTRSRFLADLKEIFEPKIAEHHGRLVKTMGDGLLVEFPSIVNALRCAIEVQQAEAKKNAGLPSDQQLQFRIGINLGDVIAEGEDVHGDGVNIADRLQNLADPGGIVVSGSAYDYVLDKINVDLESLGEQSVKNIDKPIRAYRVRLDGSPAKPRIATEPLRRRTVSLAALAAMLIAAIGAWWLWAGNRHTAAAEPSIAVLPFDNLSGDPANARMADGITEDIITDLSRFRDFTVIARNSTEVYKDKPVDTRRIGKDLNVGYVLEGSFQREKDQVRITAQLIDTVTGTHVWSERYDRPADEVFAIQSEVADRIATTLGGHSGIIAGNELKAAKRKLPTDLGAYELYLLARERSKVGITDEAQIEAQKLLDKAIQIDPNLARAHTLYAWTYSWRHTYESGAPELVKQMLEKARRGVELDPMDADAHQALAYANGLSGDLKQAEIQFDEALRLNPSSFEVLTVYGCWAHNFGKAQVGAEGADRAIRLNPTIPAWAIPCLRLAMIMVGRYKDVIEIQSRQPEDEWNTDGFVMTAGSLAELGQIEEAKALAAHGVAKYPGLLSIEKFALNRG